VTTEPEFKSITCTSCGEDFEFALGDDVVLVIVATCPTCDGGGVSDVIGLSERGEYIWEGT
jgi:hypothetical protein